MPPLASLDGLRPAESYAAYAEIWQPDTLQGALTYGLDDESVMAGSVVWVHLRHRKDPALGLVVRVHHDRPTFALKPALPHASGYRFAPRYLDTLEWCSRYYLCSPGQTLTVFWPAELEKYLDQLVQPSKPRKRKQEPAVPMAEPQPPLTAEQSATLARLEPLLDGSGFRGALLHGVTGSGKTRVYQELVRTALEKGISTLVLVPEIGLTPQTRDRFERFLGRPVPVLHSNLGTADKRAAWLSLLKGQCNLLMGTRSAILAPGLAPGLIIMDEEHDASYKQQDPAPRYHCRELAFHLAHKHGALVVLGSATPSVESWENARKGNLELLCMTQRATDLPLPPVRVVDMKKQKALQSSGLLLSPALREALCDTVAMGHQAIVLHNRRGHSTARVCSECGETLECEACKIPVVYHKQHRGLLCHYCGRLYPLHTPCRHCGQSEFEFFGGGIEKVEQEIREWVPEAKILRVDRDAVQRIGAAEQMFTAFRNREYNILLGTQMVAKGHDFPGVNLVGVISADTGSGIPDFRSGERLFQLLTQVAGRAGRALDNSRVILQTHRPDDPVLRFALKHNYRGFADWERQERSDALYPPFCRIANLELSASDSEQLWQASARLADLLGVNAKLQVLGPVDAFVAMVNSKHRKTILLKAPQAVTLREAITTALADTDFKKLSKNVTIKVDMDA